jgi:hypothetical protein
MGERNPQKEMWNYQGNLDKRVRIDHPLCGGSTGVGKSRAMWILLRRLLDQEHRRVAWLNAVRFRTGLQAAARDGATDFF